MSAPSQPRRASARLRSLARRDGRTSGVGPVDIVRRLGWGVTDQAVSSLSNFALGIVVARSLGSEGFGAFSMAYVTYAFVLSAARGLTTDPLLVRFSGAPSSTWRNAVAASTATAVAVGMLTGTACVVIGLLVPGTTGGAFIALGVGLPGLLLQDSWRFAFFSAGRPVKALVNDLVWGGMLLTALAGLLVTDRASVTTCFLAFSGSAALAAGFGLLQSRILPRPRAVRPWLHDHRALGGRYLVENLSMGGARHLRILALAAFAGLAAVGDTRAAEILMGPFLVILTGASQVAVPEAAQVLRRRPRQLGWFCFGLGAVLAMAAAVWGVTILALLSSGLGELLLGPIWAPASALLPPVIIAMFMACFTVATAAGLRALGAAPRSLNAQLSAASLYVVGGSVGALVDGARGSCWGVAAATAIGALVWRVQLRRALSEFLTGPSDIETPDHHLDGIAT